MIYTKTGEYAIRAVLYLARQPREKLVMSAEIAKSEDIPAHYLAKILQRMAKFGYVDSFKGRGGGFLITELALNSSILEIVERIEGPVINLKCVTGLKECSEEHPCPLHNEWAQVRDRIFQLISSRSVKEVAAQYAETLNKEN
ncbi:MAG: Rrf2 family transcriptional regulator [Bacteroidota bacterium]|nr:Rrf2 family transcriptional regulator [Bacteroidota bacterium]MDP4192852.1 Rrf2 family transcriptional regulator [Bacteroidota bacterium]MDP4196621.1 Rrf2 family transcriptional regulator [Bacteroidota bacterium]